MPKLPKFFVILSKFVTLEREESNAKTTITLAMSSIYKSSVILSFLTELIVLLLEFNSNYSYIIFKIEFVAFLLFVKALFI